MMGNIDVRYLMLLFPIICGIVFAMTVARERHTRKKNAELKIRESMREERNREIERYRQESKVLAKKVIECIENEDILEGLIEECSDYTGEFVSKNPAVDTLLSYKKRACKEQEIAVDFNIGEIPLDLIPEKELVSLLGNLIDNAVEAAAKCEHRWIKVESKNIKGQWVLKMENSKPEEEKPLETHMKTTKQDIRQHGLGALIVKKIVAKNKGHIKHYDKGASFETFLSLPIKKEAKNVEHSCV